MILNVNEILEKYNNDLIEKISKLTNKLVISTIRVGNNPGAVSYENSIKRQAKTVGIEVDCNVLKANTSLEDIKKLIENKNQDQNIDGILVFSPIENINMSEVFDCINPNKDVDGQSTTSRNRLHDKTDLVNVATTAVATFEYLKSITKLESKDIMIINRSNIIGIPLANMLLGENATVLICHSKTKDLENKMQNFDIIVSAVGRAEIFNPSKLKEEAIIIDLGYSLDSNNKAKGDFKNIFHESKERYLPSVGGIGKLNSNIILRNTYINGVKNGK